MLNLKRSLGSVGTIGLLGHRLGVHDAMLGLMGTVSQILTSAVYLLSPLTVYLMYIAPFVDIFNGVNSIVNRSLLAKTVSKDELGEIRIRRAKGPGPTIFQNIKNKCVFNKHFNCLGQMFLMVSWGKDLGTYRSTLDSGLDSLQFQRQRKRQVEGP